jgi:hypothetical protein
MASSTSSANTFSPPVLMIEEPRPSRWILPSASTVAWSPGKDQVAPPITRKVLAVFAGSL